MMMMMMINNDDVSYEYNKIINENCVVKNIIVIIIGKKITTV